MKKIVKNSFFVLMLGFLYSCSDDLLEPTLAQDEVVDNSINTVEDLRLFMNGAYNFMTASEYWGRDLIISGEVRADNVFPNGNSGRFLSVGSMDMTASDAQAENIFRFAYRVIAECNIVLEAEVEGDQAQIANIKAEALALRALAHFDLVRFFGQQHVSGRGGMNAPGIPYITKFKESLSPARNSVAEVKNLIYTDLDNAIATFVTALNDGTKYTITKDAAYAIKSRVAIYFGDKAIALDACQAIINNYQIAPVNEYASTFSSTSASSNSIFELLMLSNDNNTINGLYNIYGNTAYGDIQVLDEFIADAGFDSDDIRASSSMIAIQSGKLRNVGKYPTPSYDDNIKVIRYEEVVLNYAEALLDTNPVEALNQLNRIVLNRETTPNLYTVANIDNILIERRKELCFEGFRFDDLARTNRNIPVLNAVNQVHGGPVYGSYNYAFPIPLDEMNANENMSQNFGYNQ